MEIYKFKLYVVEDTPASKALVEKLKAIFNNALKENYKLEVIDIMKHPELAIKMKIIATPTLVMEFPEPQKKIVGNLSNENSLIIGLDLLNKDNSQL